MLEEYFSNGAEYATKEQMQRLLAVQAALEIIKASASSASAGTSSNMYYDLEHASDKVGKLADAIQAALEVKKE